MWPSAVLDFHIFDTFSLNDLCWTNYYPSFLIFALRSVGTSGITKGNGILKAKEILVRLTRSPTRIIFWHLEAKKPELLSTRSTPVSHFFNSFCVNPKLHLPFLDNNQWFHVCLQLLSRHLYLRELFLWQWLQFFQLPFDSDLKLVEVLSKVA